MYANLSNSIKLTGKKLIAKSIESVDALGAQIIDGMDLKPYVPKRLPKGIVRFMMKTAIGGIRSALINRKAYKHCEEYLPCFSSENQKLSESMVEEFERTKPLDQLCATLFGKLGHWLAFVSLPTLTAALMARSKTRKMFGEDSDPDRLVLLERAFPHNVTIEMSESLYRLSQFDEVKELEGRDVFLEKLDRGELSSEFLSTWNHFMDNYGFRCPREMDIATPRYHENPGNLFDLLKSMQPAGDSRQTPDILFAKGAEATDPGWTPLFLNAEGIVIQNGGVLQHGASVARESCKPYIVGVQNATSILRDGQLVEMDGSSGIVKIVDSPGGRT